MVQESASLMSSTKAVITDVDCIIRPFEGGIGGLINYVLATNDDMASQIEGTFQLLVNELGLTERSIAAYLMGYLRDPESLKRGLSEVPESVRPADEEYWSTLDTLRNSVKLASESGAYLNQVHGDFARAASDWKSRGFKSVVYSERLERERIVDVLESAGLVDDVAAVKVPRDEHKEWLPKVSKDLSLDLPASFVIAAHTYDAKAVRRRFHVKTAVLESSIYERGRYSRPYDERGYYLVLGSFLDIDPMPDGVDIREEVHGDTSLAAYIKRSG